MSGAGAQKLVLVADDHADVRELVVFRLGRAGFEVIDAADGERAVSLALERRADVCVIDVMMPKLDGDAVTERLREAPGLERTVIVLLTASVQNAAIERGYETGGRRLDQEAALARRAGRADRLGARPALAALRSRR